MKKLSISLISLFLGACAVSSQSPAPIVNGNVVKSVNNTPTPIVSTKPTIAPVSNSTSSTDDNGTKISKMNDDEDSSTMDSQSKAKNTQPSPIVKPTNTIVTNSSSNSSSVVIDGVSWTVPTNGEIVSKYTAASKGVDVSGISGQAIIAANDGTVAYSGNGLKGYGNLIIIKHANNYLTAYSHNKVNLVKEGASIKRGQKIAEMGVATSNKPLLHFELRKNGKPIDPSPIFQKNEN